MCVCMCVSVPKCVYVCCIPEDRLFHPHGLRNITFQEFATSAEKLTSLGHWMCPLLH